MRVMLTIPFVCIFTLGITGCQNSGSDRYTAVTGQSWSSMYVGVLRSDGIHYSLVTDVDIKTIFLENLCPPWTSEYDRNISYHRPTMIVRFEHYQDCRYVMFRPGQWRIADSEEDRSFDDVDIFGVRDVELGHLVYTYFAGQILGASDIDDRRRQILQHMRVTD